MARRALSLSDRRTFLKGTGAAAVVGLAGCIGDADDDDDDVDPADDDDDVDPADDDDDDDDDEPEEAPHVRFILNPAEEDADIVQEYTPMRNYLVEETGADVELIRAGSYVETLTALEANQGDLADTSPTAVPGGEGFADVVGMRTAFGGSLYFSLIITTPDSGIDELADLEGETMTVGSLLSLSATLAPTLMLAQAGLDVGTFPDGDSVDLEIRSAGDHFTSKEQMVNDPEIMAAGVGAFAAAGQIPQEQFDEFPDFVEHSTEYDGAGSDLDDDDTQELQLLAASDPLPRAPIMARSAWDDPIREDIEQALFDAEEEDLIPPDVDPDYELWFTGIEPADRDTYQPVSDIMAELGLEFEDFA